MYFCKKLVISLLEIALLFFISKKSVFKFFDNIIFANFLLLQIVFYFFCKSLRISRTKVRQASKQVLRKQ